MKKYRITKYNPIYRDDEGKYLIDEWTSYTDIGKKIGDKLCHGDVIAKIYTNGKNTQDAMNKIFEAFSVSEDEVIPHEIILDVVRGK